MQPNREKQKKAYVQEIKDIRTNTRWKNLMKPILQVLEQLVIN